MDNFFFQITFPDGKFIQLKCCFMTEKDFCRQITFTPINSSDICLEDSLTLYKVLFQLFMNYVTFFISSKFSKPKHMSIERSQNETNYDDGWTRLQFHTMNNEVPPPSFLKMQPSWLVSFWYRLIHMNHLYVVIHMNLTLFLEYVENLTLIWYLTMNLASWGYTWPKIFKIIFFIDVFFKQRIRKISNVFLFRFTLKSLGER